MNNEQAKKRVRAFMVTKKENPRAQFGAKDETFVFDSKFEKAVPGIRHAHITNNISILYRIVGNNHIELYGYYTHDELGTGTPRSVQKNTSMANKFSKEVFPTKP